MPTTKTVSYSNFLHPGGFGTLRFIRSDCLFLLVLNALFTGHIVLQNDSFRPSVRSRIKDALFIILLLLAVMLFFALLTYEPTDSNYWDNDPERVRNAIGPFGAHVSEVLFSYFGICAFTVPLLLIALGYFMFLKAGSKRWYEIDYDLLSIKILGLNVLLISACTLVSACIYSGSFSSKGGGHLGAVTLELLRDHLGYNGSVLAMLALFVVGLTLFTGFSLVSLCSFIGGCVLWLVDKVMSLATGRKPKQVEATSVNNAAPVGKVEEQPCPIKVVSSQARTNVASNNTQAEPTAPIAPVNQAPATDVTKVNANVANATSEAKPTPAYTSPYVSNPYVEDTSQAQSGATQTPTTAVASTAQAPANGNNVGGAKTSSEHAQANTPGYTVASPSMSSYIDANNPAPSSIPMPSMTKDPAHDPYGQAAQASARNENKEVPVATTQVGSASAQESYRTQENNRETRPQYASTMVLSNKTSNAKEDDASLTIPGLGSAYGEEAKPAPKAEDVLEERTEPSINFDTVDEAVADDDVPDYMSATLFGNPNKKPVSTQTNSSVSNATQAETLARPENKFQSTNVLPSPNRPSEMTIKVNPEAMALNTNSVAPKAPATTPVGAAPTVTATPVVAPTVAPLPGFTPEPDMPLGVNAPTGIKPVKTGFYSPNSFMPQEQENKEGPAISVIEGGLNDNGSNVIDFAAIHPQSIEHDVQQTMPHGNFTPMASGVERGLHGGRDATNSVNVNNGAFNNAPNSGFVAGMSNAAAGHETQDATQTSNVAQAPVSNGTGMRYVDFTADLPDSINYHQGQYEHDGTPLSKFPSLDIFNPPVAQAKVPVEELEDMSNSIDECMKHFGIKAHVARDVSGHRLYECGPVITRYMLELDSGKSNKIVNMQSDIARTLCVAKVRVIEVIPGVPYVGIEIPNKIRQNINVRELLSGSEFINTRARLPICLGRDITGAPVIYDLASAPHLMVAGTTGSGKSVGINTMLVSLLMKNTPEELRLILIDPKMLEFKPYHDIPHLLTPVITDMKESVSALRWSVQEMERRYKLLAHFRVRNIDGFNEIIRNAKKENVIYKDPFWHPNDSMDMEAPGLDVMPYIVFVIDEFADLILGMKKESGDIEGMISRLAAKARACGIHLILATQSPRAEVIRGSIRANFPSQIAFKVKSAMESRIIIDECGAENLLGRGDMLIKFNDGTGSTRRAHGGYLSDEEISRFTDAWRMRGRPNYVEEVTKVELTEETAIPGEYVPSSNSNDALYDDVVEFVRSLKFKNRQFSVSLVQQHFNIGYNRASRIAQLLQDNGIVSEPMGASKTRSILLDD